MSAGAVYAVFSHFGHVGGYCMTKGRINCTSARPIPPHTNPMESGPRNTFSAKNQKNQKIHDFNPKKEGGGYFVDIFYPTPPPHHPLASKPEKSGFQVGNSLGDAFIGRNNDLTRG